MFERAREDEGSDPVDERKSYFKFRMQPTKKKLHDPLSPLATFEIKLECEVST